jgi:uncharacterized LabA/DUF88 family protein
MYVARITFWNFKTLKIENSNSMRNDHEYLFIDGRHLHETLRTFSSKYFDSRKVMLDARLLTSGFQKCFYYDCDPVRRDDENEQDFKIRKSEADSFEMNLVNQPGVHIYKGAIRGMGKKTRQKGVDVAIAVDMLTHSYRKNIGRATLFAGDLDFLPLVEALVLDGLYVTLWYCRERTSKELINAVDQRKLFSVNSIYDFLDTDFRLTIPQKPTESSRARIQGRNPIRSGIWEENGSKIEIFETDGTYELTAWDGSSQNEVVRSHPSMELLVDFCQEQFCWGLKWDSEIKQNNQSTILKTY